MKWYCIFPFDTTTSLMMKRGLDDSDYSQKVRLMFDPNDRSLVINGLQYDCINLSFLDNDLLSNFQTLEKHNREKKQRLRTSQDLPASIDIKSNRCQSYLLPLKANGNYQSNLNDLHRFIDNLESDLDQIDQLVLQKFNSPSTSSIGSSVDYRYNTRDSVDSNSSYYDESFDNDSIFTINDL